MSISGQDATDSFDNSLIVIKGGTDNSSIGNTGTSLNVYNTAASPLESLETFEAYAPAVAPAANKSMFSILNSSTKIVKIRSIYLTNVSTTAITGVMLNFELHRLTGYTGGTALTPFPYDLSDTLGTITCATGATVSGEGATIRRWIWSSDEHGVGTLDQEGNDYGFQYAFPIFKQDNNGSPLYLRQNQGITLKQTVASTVGAFDINVIFTQE